MPLRRPAAAVMLAAAFLVPAAAADEPAPPKFAWAVPSKVVVTEKMEKVGHTATTRYTVSLERHGESGDVRVRLSGFEFIDLDGKPSSDPVVAEQMKMALPMAKALPDLVVGADGAVKDVLGLDATISTMLDEMSKTMPEAQKAQLPAIRAQFDSPPMRARMKKEVAKHWGAWVGEWAGRSIPEGQPLETSHPMACPDGTEVQAPTVYKRSPAESEGAGFVKLTRESVLDGDDAKPSFDAWMAKVTAATGRTLPATGMRLVDRVAVVTDPATLRPKWVRREEQKILHLKDLPDKTEIERHEYQFDWSAAETPKTDTGK